MSRSFFLAELFDRHYIQMSLWKAVEELRKFGVHGVDMLSVEVENLLARLRMEFGITVDGCAKTLEIFVAKLIGDLHHAGFDFLYLRQTDLVNLLGRQVRSGAVFHRE